MHTDGRVTDTEHQTCPSADKSLREYAHNSCDLQESWAGVACRAAGDVNSGAPQAHRISPATTEPTSIRRLPLSRRSRGLGKVD